MLGRDHWAGVVATARGDRGARDYLRRASAVLVECGDLATGRRTGHLARDRAVRLQPLTRARVASLGEAARAWHEALPGC